MIKIISTVDLPHTQRTLGLREQNPAYVVCCCQMRICVCAQCSSETSSEFNGLCLPGCGW